MLSAPPMTLTKLLRHFSSSFTAHLTPPHNNITALVNSLNLQRYISINKTNALDEVARLRMEIGKLKEQLKIQRTA